VRARESKTHKGRERAVSDVSSPQPERDRERGNETSDDKRSDDITSKAERKRKSEASPVKFCRKSLVGGNVWDFLADLLKIMKLRGAGSDDVKEVREIVQHLFTNIVRPARSRRDS